MYRKKFKETNSSCGSVLEFTQNDGKSFQNQSSPQKKHFIAWLQVFSEKVGDYMPDETATVLPYPKFEGVYLEYKQEMEKRMEEHCCYSYACRIFGEEIQNIRLVCSKGSFVCCKICTNYQTRILTHPLELDQLLIS